MESLPDLLGCCGRSAGCLHPDVSAPHARFGSTFQCDLCAVMTLSRRSRSFEALKALLTLQLKCCDSPFSTKIGIISSLFHTFIYVLDIHLCPLQVFLKGLYREQAKVDPTNQQSNTKQNNAIFILLFIATKYTQKETKITFKCKIYFHQSPQNIFGIVTAWIKVTILHT